MKTSNSTPSFESEIDTPAHAPYLFSTFELKGKAKISNRFFKSAMSEVLAKDGEHLPNEKHFKVYKRWAEGGSGILLTGNVMIDKNALAEPGNVLLEDDRHLDRFEAWVNAVRTVNPETQFWMQLNHPGKQTNKYLVPTPVAPSAIPLGKGLDKMFAPPRALENDEIEDIIRRFATASRIAKKAGFDGVQVHCAHGYLVSQFLSPHHNRREDKWGGSIENRRRFILEIYRAIRNEVGNDFIVSVKMNSADFQKGGFEGEEAFELIEKLSEEGIDLIEISGGQYESMAMLGANQSKSTREREAYFLDFAAKARLRTKVPIVVTGGFRSVKAMEEAIATGATDFVGLGRPLTIDPDLPKRAAKDPNYVRDVGSPTTGIKSFDEMLMLDGAYYESQIIRMARGKNPNPKLSAWRTVYEIFVAIGLAAFRRRRAKKK